jgi:hypothetical protein
VLRTPLAHVPLQGAARTELAGIPLATATQRGATPAIAALDRRGLGSGPTSTPRRRTTPDTCSASYGSPPDSG